MKKEKLFFEKLAEYYSGESEQEQLRNEFEKDRQSKEFFYRINSFWYHLNPHPHNIDRIRNLVFQKVDRQKKRFLTVFRYAAIIILFFSLGTVTYVYMTKRVDYLTVRTGVGEIKSIEMPDGSMVWLNALSEVSYPENFKGHTREVKMDGEVYFDVKHDQSHPFIVLSSQFRVRVLGTSFLISNYHSDPIANAYLKQGSVELESTKLSEKVLLVPGEIASFNENTLEFSKRRDQSLNSMLDSWRYGKISFYNETLSQVARTLERRFGKKILIDVDVPGTMKLTADFKSEDLDEILNYLGVLGGFKYELTQQGYLLTKK